MGADPSNNWYNTPLFDPLSPIFTPLPPVQ